MKKNINKQIAALIHVLDVSFHIFVSVGFKIFGVCAILYEILNFRSDSFGLTYYGLALSLSISSVSFSWSRNIANETRTKFLHLNDIGMNALYAAIAFLMGTVLKFAVITKDIKFITTLLTDLPIYGYIIKTFALICFVLATWWFSEAITDLLRIIHMTRIRGWNEEKEAEDWKKYRE
jgi:hypothetical protein